MARIRTENNEYKLYTPEAGRGRTRCRFREISAGSKYTVRSVDQKLGKKLSQLRFCEGKKEMSAERELVLKTRAEMRDADKAWRDAQNAEYRCRMAYDAAKRRWNDLELRLGPDRVRNILAGGQ
jgi:hypothetical protein